MNRVALLGRLREGACAAFEDEGGCEAPLHVLLLASLVLALVPLIQRTVQISRGGLGTADHVQTLVVAAAATAVFSALLVLSRRGSLVAPACSLLGVYYAVGVWSIVAEGPGKNTTILICGLLVVAAGALGGSRVALLSAVLISMTVAVVEILDWIGALSAPTEASPAVPDAAGAVEIVGTLATMALALSARSRSSGMRAAKALDERAPRVPLAEGRSRKLTRREIQVVNLIAVGRSNDEIAQELVVSPRTVHSHVSSALHKTGCANRTELAVLAVREGLAESPTAQNRTHAADLPTTQPPLQ